MSKTKLKNCPFCGGQPTTYNAIDQMWGLSLWYVLCDCGCRLGDCETEEKIIEAWNRRAEKVAVRYRADKENGKYVCSECGHNVIWNPEREDELMMWHPYCNTCGARILRIEDYDEPKQEI